MKEAKKLLHNLERDCGPSLEAVNLKQEYRQRIEACLPDRLQALREAENAADVFVDRVGTINEQLEGLNHKRDAEKQSLQAKRAELGQIRRRITGLETRLKGDQREFNAAEWNIKIGS